MVEKQNLGPYTPLTSKDLPVMTGRTPTSCVLKSYFIILTFSNLRPEVNLSFYNLLSKLPDHFSDYGVLGFWGFGILP